MQAASSAKPLSWPGTARPKSDTLAGRVRAMIHAHQESLAVVLDRADGNHEAAGPADLPVVVRAGRDEPIQVGRGIHAVEVQVALVEQPVLAVLHDVAVAQAQRRTMLDHLLRGGREVQDRVADQGVRELPVVDRQGVVDRIAKRAVRNVVAHRGRRNVDRIGLAALDHPPPPRLAANRAFLAPVEILPFDGHAAGEEVGDDHVPMLRFQMPQHGLQVLARVAPPHLAGRHSAQLVEAVGTAPYPTPPGRRVQVDEEDELRLGIDGQLVGHLPVQALEVVLPRPVPDGRIGVVVGHARRCPRRWPESTPRCSRRPRRNGGAFPHWGRRC